MLLPIRSWDEDDARYVRNAVLIGCAVALFTEVVRGAVDLAKSRLEKRLDQKPAEPEASKP